MIALYIILALLLLLLAVVFIRTLLFRPKQQATPFECEVAFDREKAVENLRELVRFKTISYENSNLEDNEQFEALVSALPHLYPKVFETCSFTRLPDRALLIGWKGEKSDAPTVFMSHYDVVPVEAEMWEKPPFEAILEDNVIWGRGTLDTKATLNACLSAANTLIEKGFVPKNDIWFAFSGGEEINGNGAVNIVNWFKENGIKPNFVLDEGGAVVENVFPGVKGACGLIGVAEKGMINLQFSINSNGGHASAPKPHTPIGILSKACCKVEKNPFKMRLTKPVALMFDTLGRHSTLLYRVIFANLWLFGGALDLLGRLSGGEINAMLRTTVAFTQSAGSSAPNVIPPTAKLVANMRLNPADTVESAKNYIEKTVGNKDIKLNVLHCENPSPIAPADCDEYKKIATAVAGTWKGCLVSPYLMVQCSDSRHYRDLCEKVYKFSAMDLTSEERASIHGHNERIRLETLYRSVEFYIRLINQC